jgi:hypothetical protein
MCHNSTGVEMITILYAAFAAASIRITVEMSPTFMVDIVNPFPSSAIQKGDELILYREELLNATSCHRAKFS